MIKVEPCINCLDVIFVVELGGTRIKADPTPLDAMGAVSAITDQRELYRVKQLGKVPATIGSAGPEVLRALNAEPGDRPHVVREHRCTLASRPRTPSPVSGATTPPPQAPAARTTASQGRSTGAYSVPVADPRGTRPLSVPEKLELKRQEELGHLPCENCGEELGGPENRMMMELGATVLWAIHGDCPRR